MNLPDLDFLTGVFANLANMSVNAARDYDSILMSLWEFIYEMLLP